MNEQRKYPRIPVALEIKSKQSPKDRGVPFVTKDLGVGGVFIETTQVFPMDEKLDLNFKLPYAHGELSISGKIIRHEQDSETGLISGMAIEFFDLSDVDQGSLDSYIHSTLNSDSKKDD